MSSMSPNTAQCRPADKLLLRNNHLVDLNDNPSMISIDFLWAL